MVALTSFPAIAAEKSPAHPKRFEASIGGFLGTSYHLKLEGGALTYTRFEGGRRNPDRSRITPSPEQWTVFRKAIDDSQLWNWRKEYVNADVRDGTQWSLDLAYVDPELSSHGNNAYPDAYGLPGKSLWVTPEFQRYLQAVESLLNGKPFR